MRERLSIYFLLAVLSPLAFGTLVSELLIERHIVALARASAEERLETIAGRLEDRSRFVQMGLTQLATSHAPHRRDRRRRRGGGGGDLP